MPLLTKDSQEAQKVLSKILAKAWLDEDFKSQFLSNTNIILEENGLEIPSDVEFKVQENTLVGILRSTEDSQSSNIVYEIPLPTKPSELADQPIQSWVSGNNSNASILDYEEGDCKYSG